MEPLPQSRNERLNHGAGSRTPPGNRPGFQPSAEPVHSDDVDRRPLGTRQSCLQKEAVCGETADNPCRVRDVYAPVDLKATFFAVMASFTNLALSASSLLTKYVNQIFLVTREVKDRATGAEVPADYSQLGWLLITVTLVGVLAPLMTVFVVQRSQLRTRD
jgi:hypothetical protein